LLQLSTFAIVHRATVIELSRLLVRVSSVVVASINARFGALKAKHTENKK
jgi:Flp pilus assembly pilin Flp